MFKRTIVVNVDPRTFPGGNVPGHIKASSALSIDLIEAFMLLGNITVPGGFTTASPARYWAWIRYFSSISAATDLRITWPFADLDPHQKGILSDDFGVAICTQWLINALGGVRSVVDGRRFMAQYSSLLAIPSKGKTPKVGRGKCPDFVVEDKNGRWHVLECKGTQVGRKYRDKQLRMAKEQKRVISIAGTAKGDQLAAGFFISNDRHPDKSHMKLVDPPADGYVTIDGRRRAHAETAAARLTASRALGLSGFTALGDELSIPPELSGPLRELFRPAERRRFEIPAEMRLADALENTRTVEGARFTENSQHYVGREATFQIPAESFLQNTGFRRIRIKQGTSEDVVEQFRAITSDPIERIDSMVRRCSVRGSAFTRPAMV
jgi:hypothetical protein